MRIQTMYKFLFLLFFIGGIIYLFTIKWYWGIIGLLFWFISGYILHLFDSREKQLLGMQKEDMNISIFQRLFRKKRMGLVIGCGFTPTDDDMKGVGELLVRNDVDISNLSFHCVEARGSGGAGTSGVYIGMQSLSDIITEKEARFIYEKVRKKEKWPLKYGLWCKEFTLYGSRLCWVVFPIK